MHGQGAMYAPACRHRRAHTLDAQLQQQLIRNVGVKIQLENDVNANNLGDESTMGNIESFRCCYACAGWAAACHRSLSHPLEGRVDKRLELRVILVFQGNTASIGGGD